MTANRYPTRILHVVGGGMGPAGIETWLLHVLRHIDRERFRNDVVVHSREAHAYDEELRTLGSLIIPCSDRHKPVEYARNFRRILRSHGPYDIVHSHVFNYSGYILHLARQSGVPTRIAHSHSTFSWTKERARTLRRIYSRTMRSWIADNATLGLAVSREAANALFGTSWEADPRWRILYCGIDLEPFRTTVHPPSVRAELGIPADAFVVGHVGRFHEAKNHAFLVDVAVEVAKREPNMRLLLVGDGPLRSAIERRASQAGVANKAIFTGIRADVSRLMLGAMDTFVFPSLYEGLPLAGVEAQAAGLPLILSDAIPKEIGVVNPLVRRLSSSQAASVWAEAVLDVQKSALPITQQGALRLLDNSRFNVVHSAEELADIYAA